MFKTILPGGLKDLSEDLMSSLPIFAAEKRSHECRRLGGNTVVRRACKYLIICYAPASHLKLRQ